MRLEPPILHHERRLAGLAATVALHFALLYGWHLARQDMVRADDADPTGMQWVTIAPPRPVKPTTAVTPARARPVQARQAATATQTPAASPIAPEAISTPIAAAPATPSAAEMMQQARKDLGKIDKQLRKEFPGPRIKAPVDTPQARLERGIEHAAEMAPPKWYEGPKVKEIIDPGGYGRRRYRVITANGTYCVTYESNHAPDGIDSMKNGIKPKLTTCPAHEQPATEQKW
jgi:hypothetical protein